MYFYVIDMFFVSPRCGGYSFSICTIQSLESSFQFGWIRGFAIRGNGKQKCGEKIHVGKNPGKKGTKKTQVFYPVNLTNR